MENKKFSKNCLKYKTIRTDEASGQRPDLLYNSSWQFSLYINDGHESLYTGLASLFWWSCCWTFSGLLNQWCDGGEYWIILVSNVRVQCTAGGETVQRHVSLNSGVYSRLQLPYENRTDQFSLSESSKYPSHQDKTQSRHIFIEGHADSLLRLVRLTGFWYTAVRQGQVRWNSVRSELPLIYIEREKPLLALATPHLSSSL